MASRQASPSARAGARGRPWRCERMSRRFRPRPSFHALVPHPHLLPHPDGVLAFEVNLEELAAHDRLALAPGLVRPPGDDLLRGRVEDLPGVAPGVLAVAAETDPAV